MTSQQSKCHLCSKNIEKGQKRILLDNDNTYYNIKKYYHLNCMIKKLNDFKDFKPEERI